MSSQLLIERIQHGDRDAIGLLIERHLPALRGYVRLHAGRALRQQESCSDLVQSVCRELLADLNQFEYRGEQQFRLWLYTAARHKLANRAKYHVRVKRDVGRNLALDDSSRALELIGCYASFCTPSELLTREEELTRIESAVDALPRTYREVILLSSYVGLPLDEVARELGHSAQYTRTLLSRARARLTTLLDAPRG